LGSALILAGPAFHLAESTPALFAGIEVTFGMSSGTSGDKYAKDQEGSGEGMGMGVKARPSVFIVIKGEEVELLFLRKPGSLEKFPEIMEKFPCKPGKREGKKSIKKLTF